jgi:ribose transport system ATP-binding protein
MHLISSLSVAENIMLGRLPKGRLPGAVSWKNAGQRATEVIENLGVTLDVWAKVEDLNVAQKQVVEIAKALSRDARIVVMDEPTAALTDREVQGLFHVIKTLKGQGVSIIYISHRLDEIFDITDRVTVMRDGRYVGTVDVSQATHAQLVKMMVGRELKDMYPKRDISVGQEILRVKNLSQGENIHNINFTVHQGEILGIFGLMGSGRTHLAKALFGDTKKDGGQVFVQGQAVKIDTPEQAKEAGLGLVPVDRKGEGLLLNQSLRRNVTLANLSAYMQFGFTRRNAERASAKKWIQKLDIRAHSIDQRVMNLSGGNQQKVTLAKWLETDMKVLILNEPTWGIDVGAKAEIYRLLEDLCEQGLGVIMMSSELPEILAMADRILVMCQGRITAEYSRETATQELLLQAAIGGVPEAGAHLPGVAERQA